MNPDDKSMIVTLDSSALSSYLSQVGMILDVYGRIVPAGEPSFDWVQVQAPADAAGLLLLARTAVSALPIGEWSLFQFDNASYFDPVDRFQISRLLFGDSARLATCLPRSLLFADSSDEAFLVLADLICLSLLHRAHAQVVTSECRMGECLSIEDGFLYACVDERRQDDRTLEALGRLSGRLPGGLPDWMFDANGRFQ